MMRGRSRSEIKDIFERDGFVIVEGALEPDRCAELIDQTWQRLPKRFRRDQLKTWTGRIEDCCNNLPTYQRNGLLRYKDKNGFRHEPAIDRHIYSNPKVRLAFESVTGRSLGRLHVRGLHPVLPMPRWVSINEVTGNRLDTQLDRLERNWPKIPCPRPLPIEGHVDAHPIDVLMIVYLDEVAPAGGGLAVWPGSHRLLTPCFESLYDFLPTRAYRRAIRFLQRFRPVDLAAGQGDVILVHNRLLHSNSLNTTTRIRHAVLVDCFGEGWRERDEVWRRDKNEEKERRDLAAVDDVSTLPLAMTLVSQLTADPVRAFWSRHLGLRGFISGIGKDPLAKARRQLSAKIRSRREGDCWIVVSQDPSHETSHKLDSYGAGSLGKYKLSVNGRDRAKSLSGVIVERIELRDGENEIELRGRFKTQHHVRVIRTGNPVAQSSIVYSGTIRTEAHRHHHRISILAPLPS